MFHSIPSDILREMHRLEAIDARDRVDGTGKLERLRQIPPETGRFLAILAASAPQGQWIEVGTSAGYSGLWLALAARATGNRLRTYEVLDAKANLTAQAFRAAAVEDVIELINGDARDHLSDSVGVSFCFLDAEKEVYADCYEAVVPRMVKGGLLVCDNVISHRDELEVFVQRALADTRVDTVVVPIGKGELLCRRSAD